MMDKELDRLSSRNLFYPCSGRDVNQPIEECWNDVGHFWFVDPRYDGLPGPLLL